MSTPAGERASAGDDATPRWRLPTRSGDYVVARAPGGAGLVTAHWGARGGGAPWPVRRPTSFEAELDQLPLEATALGTRHVHGAEIVVRRADGVRGARLVVAGEVSVAADDGGTHLVCPLADDTVGLEVALHLRTRPDHDVVEKWAVLRNTSALPLELARAWGGAFNVPVGPGARLGLLAGAWSREFTPADVDLGAGTLSLGSRQGITSHTYSPVVSLTSRGAASDSYAVALAWSGSWRLAVDAVPFTGHVRVAGGPDDESGVLRLAPGGSLATPTLLGVWSAGGDPDGLADAWHTYQRSLARSTGPEHRPVVYNSWYATTFDVRVEHQLALADVAARVGAEVFVVDDGWFRGRTSDAAGLGDWEADTATFPAGLEPLVRGVRERGMRFGIWVEPEAVNPDSDLYRAHPEWTHHVAGRSPQRLRNQYVLDLGQPGVETWVADTLRRLLSAYDISYLKWDMNRSVSDGGAAHPGGADWAWRHARAYYRVLDVLRAEFPQVTVEACAGGGGRIDNAVLARTDVVWPSDETGPRDRLAIQHGFLSAYPSWAMSSWVTDEPDVLDDERASLEFRFVVAMAGVLGIGADLLAWSAETRARAAEMVALYRRIRPVVHGGRVRRHGSPADGAYAVQYTTPSAAVVFAWRRPGGTLVVPRCDLDAGASYRIGDTVRTGASLASEPLEVAWRWGDCDVVVLERV